MREGEEEWKGVSAGLKKGFESNEKKARNQCAYAAFTVSMRYESGGGGKKPCLIAGYA